MIKVIKYIFILFLCILTVQQSLARKYEAIVLDVSTGKVLHEECADCATQPASLTKMMTLLLLFRAIETGKISLKDSIRVSFKASHQPPSKLGLRSGSYISVNNAILALITKSANDIAVAISEKLAGSEELFAIKMNQEAARLGLTSTVFKNASGLPNPKQKTTARDMAKLSIALIKKFPKYYRLFATKSFFFKGNSYSNHNHLLGKSKMMLVDGIKTGYVQSSGYNLSASAVVGNKRIVAVVLGGPTKEWRDARVFHLLRCSFENKLSDIRKVANRKSNLNHLVDSLSTDNAKNIVVLGPYGTSNKALQEASKLKKRIKLLAEFKAKVRKLGKKHSELYFVCANHDRAQTLQKTLQRKGISCKIESSI